MRKQQLKDCSLIIDGNNLIMSLHRQLNMSGIYGGEYAAYKKNIERFLRTLLHVNVKPVIIFDGMLHKFMTQSMYKRLQNNRLGEFIERLEKIDDPSLDYGNHYPSLFLDHIIKKMAQKLKIEIHQRYGDANRLTAWLANDRQSPVLSRNSDFFLMNVKHGFVHYDSLKWNDVDIETEDVKWLACEVFHFDDLMRDLPLLPLDVIPLLAVLWGKNFIKCQKFDRLLWQVCAEAKHTGPYLKSKNAGLQYFRTNLLNALIFLMQKGPNDVVNRIVSRMNGNLDQDGHFCKDCVYLRDGKSLKELVNLAVPMYHSNTGDEWSGDVELSYDVKIAKWCLKSYLHLKFPPPLLELVHSKYIVPWVLIEDYRRPSVFECSREIRKLIYAICLNDTHTPGTDLVVYESLRNCSTKRVDEVAVKVPALLRRKCPGLDVVAELEQGEKRRRFYSMLGVLTDSQQIEETFGRLSCYVLTLKFWFDNTKPKINLVYSMIICSFCLLTKLCSADWWLSSRFSIKNPLDKKQIIDAINEFEKTGPPPNTAKWDLRDGPIVEELESPTENKSFFNERIVHCFNQWQTFVQALEWLNFVMDRPFEDPLIDIEYIFCGSICHNLADRNSLFEEAREKLESALDEKPIFEKYSRYQQAILGVLMPSK